MPENPNEYDDDAFAFATQELHNDLTTHVRNLWEAGATVIDIQGEVNNALNEAFLDVGIIEANPHRGGGPKKKDKPS